MDNNIELFSKRPLTDVRIFDKVVADADLRKMFFPATMYYPDTVNNSLHAKNFVFNDVIIDLLPTYGQIGPIEITINTIIPTTVSKKFMFNEFYVNYVPLHGAIVTLDFYLEDENGEIGAPIKVLHKKDIQKAICYHFYLVNDDYKVDFDYDRIGRVFELQDHKLYHVFDPDVKD